MKRIAWLMLIVVCFLPCAVQVGAAEHKIGVFYFPGWRSDIGFWRDIKGAVGSRSPGIAWPERIPLLGYYSEEEQNVADQHIEWASNAGISFFAYDWYWDGTNVEYEHALHNFISAKNKNGMKFSLMWANHSVVPRSLEEFDRMVDFWLDHYFKEESFLRYNDKVVVFIFSPKRLDDNAQKFGNTAKDLLARANKKVKSKIGVGIYFVAINDKPSDELEKKLSAAGYSAYTGWFYSTAEDRARRVVSYDNMVETYLDFYKAAEKTKNAIPYFTAVCPGRDVRPWSGDKALVFENATPDKFERMLRAAKKLTDSKNPEGGIVMVQSWNEFAEGAIIEPTQKWGMQYLDTIKRVFGPQPK